MDTWLPLARSVIDRYGYRRNEPDLVKRLLSARATRIIPVWRGRIPLRDTGELALLPPNGFAAAPGIGAYLGSGAGVDYLTWMLPPDAPGEVCGELAWESMREVGATLAPADCGLGTMATALAAWHVGHTRCPSCGELTEVVQAGWVRRCPNEGSEHYPRTDPAVIMAITDDDDRLLLGHASAWDAGRYSLLAGYVEPGEALEAAVRREVQEETGVHVGELRYAGSQPWPFPASLMVGFVGRAENTDVQVDGIEVTEAGWFDRDRLVQEVDKGAVTVPMRSSIARAMIEDWLGHGFEAP